MVAYESLHVCSECNVLHVTSRIESPDECGACGNDSFGRVRMGQFLSDTSSVEE